MQNEKTNLLMKPLEEMNVIDDFLFTEIMSDEKNGLMVCRMILEAVLKRKIGRIEYTAQKLVPGISERTHGIRMDAYITENDWDPSKENSEIKVYDIEPDKRVSNKNGLPKRSRYYGDLIDVQLLQTGIDYERLPELVTIFILSYDPFGENDMYYEAGSILKTHPHKPYNDGVRRIFLYIDGELADDADEESVKLKNLLKYIGNSTDRNVIDETTRKLDDIVRSTKTKKDIGIRYMKSWERERELREDGLEQGLKEGRKQGREEGREEGANLKLISLIRRKTENGQSVEKISEDLMEDISMVKTIFDMINSSSTDSDIIRALNAKL